MNKNDYRSVILYAKNYWNLTVDVREKNVDEEEIVHYLIEQMEQLTADHPLVYVAAMINVVILLLAVIIGIPANIYVMVRMTKLERTDKEKYRHGTGMALWTLAVSDLCAIILTAIQNLMFVTPVPHYTNERLMHFFCKAILFSTHASTGISIWSWLLLSTLRYLAVRHPLYHLRLWRMPYRVIAFVICTSIGVNGFLLKTVVATFITGPSGIYVECMEEEVFSKAFMLSFHALEIVWSFCLPFVMIVFMDASVVLKGATYPNLLSRLKRKNRALRTVVINVKSTSIRIKNPHTHPLKNWLTIAVICIMLNTPHNFILCTKLLQASVFETSLLSQIKTLFNPFFRVFEVVAQTLYFGQFGFNTVYLVLFVFDKSIKPRSVNKDQVSTNASRATIVNCHKERSQVEPMTSNGYLSLKQTSV